MLALVGAKAIVESTARKRGAEDLRVGVVGVLMSVLPDGIPNIPATTTHMSERLIFLKNANIVLVVRLSCRWPVVVQSEHLAVLKRLDDGPAVCGGGTQSCTRGA